MPDVTVHRSGLLLGSHPCEARRQTGRQRQRLGRSCLTVERVL